MVCKATVKTEKDEKYYYGQAEGTFKQRWRNHMSSIWNDQSHQKTPLSNYVWSLKGKNENYEISWNIEKKTTPYKQGMKSCKLCVLEKKDYFRRRQTKDAKLQKWDYIQVLP